MPPIWKYLQRTTPRWLAILAFSSFAYTTVNFIVLTMVFHLDSGNTTTRLFSGHYLAFYGIATAVLYPYLHKPEDSTLQ